MSVQSTLMSVVIIVAFSGIGCRGTLPPTEPPRSAPEGAPAMHANDSPIAGPLADDNLASPPDTLPGPTNPGGIAEPADSSQSPAGSAGSAAR